MLAMITDKREIIRELGIDESKARSKRTEKTTIPRLCVPKLYFDAEEYNELVDWQTIDLTEPPVTKSMKDQVLDMISSKSSRQLLLISHFPCHTQAVEQCIKLVTEASGAVCGVTSRDGFIRSRIVSRSEMPRFESKRDYLTT